MKNTKDTKSVNKENTKQNKVKELEKEIQQLALTIDKVEDEKLEIINQLKRALADYHNLEANTQKRLNLMYFQSKKSLAESLIPIVDDLTMAVRSKEGMELDQKASLWADGVIAILQNLEKSLNEIGLEKYVPAKGTSFDPMIHEALSVIEGEIPGVVYDVIQPGYILDEKVIRPSRVVVTKNK